MPAAIAVSAVCLAGLAGIPATAAYGADGLAGSIHYASDIAWVSAENGWGPVELDYNNGARAVPDPDRTIQSIRGTKYPKGLGTHAPAKIVYDVGAQCTQLLGYVGIDDSQSGKGRVDFVVAVDGTEKFRMERTGTSPAGRLNLDLRGASRVELRAEPGPEGNGNDHADWADLKFNCTDGFVAQPLALTAKDVDLSLLAPGMPVSIAIEGAAPRVPVTVAFGDTSVVANSDDSGRAVAAFVVPAGMTAGTHAITASAEALFGAVATGEITANVVAVSDAVHHVDCSATGVGDGSADDPYTSLAQLDSILFQPGEKVLFKRGATCTGTFAPKGSGLSTAPITVAPYGDGDAEATIDGHGALAGIHLLNVSNWTVDGMHVINPGTPDQRRVGILYEINDGSKRSGVVLTRNHVEKVAGWSDKTSLGNAFSRSAGISVLGDGIGWFDGITITDNVVNDTAAGGIKLSAPDTTKHYNEKVYIARNDIRAVGGDGIVIHNSDKPVIEYNSATDLGHGEYPFLKGNFAGMWPYNSVDPLFQYNVVGNSVGSTYDSTAWDCDMKIKGSCTFQYNYSYGNAGGFYLDCISGCGTASTTTDTILRYNVSQDDCRLAGSSGGPGVHRIYNNTFSCLNRPFLDDMNAPREVKNNVFIAPGGALKADKGVYANNAWFGGIQPPAGETGSVLADLQLIAAGSGQLTRALPGYRLAVGSPLLGAGVPIADAGAHDFFGDPIPATPNIGAYQGPGVEVAPLPFRALVNQTAVASAANPRNGAITTDLRVLSAEALDAAGLRIGATASAFGSDIDWHPTAVGTPDAIKASGQQVALNGEGDELIVAGFSSGTATSGTATVHYQDGTTAEIEISLPLWSQTQVDAADTTVLATSTSYLKRTAAYIGGTISTVQEPASVFAQRIPLSGKPVASVTLPEGSPLTGDGLTLFAVELAGSAVPTSASVLTECRGPFAWVHVDVTNEHDEQVAVTVDTALGDRVAEKLKPGKDVRLSYKVSTAVDAGAATLVATTESGARTTTTVPYAAVSCR